VTTSFADTAFFLALFNPRDSFHTKAIELNRIDRPIVVTWWVLLELADHLCSVKNRILFPQVHEELKKDKRFEIIGADQTLLDRGLQTYNSRKDKEWSLTDCTSFTLMWDRGISEALTSDYHFEQAGFRALMR
jgi:predicted nucleic acid-binding protein